MKTFSLNPNSPDQKIIKEASEVLKKGGFVIYPTDTAYGLGVNALDETAIQKLYEIKGRDFSKPTHVIVKDWQMIEELVYTNEKAKKLYDKFLPGPLTMILPKKDIIPNLLVANGSTLGVRIPNSPITQLLSSLITFPYTTPSANRSGESTPYSIEEVKQVLDIEKVDLILDAGELPKIAPSTVVDLTQKEFQILREGPISKDDIEKTLYLVYTPNQ